MVEFEGFPVKKYNLIYADPPWQYKKKETGGSLNSGASQKYSVMSIEDIKNLPVHRISSDECVLFLWTTTPLLPEGLDVLKSWGFTYKTKITWIKRLKGKLESRLGLGYYFRTSTEDLLIGVKKPRPFYVQEENVIYEAAREHSKKPLKVYHLIEKIGIVPRIELFCRERREGWDSWGNQLSKTCQLHLKI